MGTRWTRPKSTDHSAAERPTPLRGSAIIALKAATRAARSGIAVAAALVGRTDGLDCRCCCRLLPTACLLGRCGRSIDRSGLGKRLLRGSAFRSVDPIGIVSRTGRRHAPASTQHTTRPRTLVTPAKACARLEGCPWDPERTNNPCMWGRDGDGESESNWGIPRTKGLEFQPSGGVNSQQLGPGSLGPVLAVEGRTIGGTALSPDR